MTRKHSPEGRIGIRGEPLGSPSEETVEIRAREIAQIDHPDDPGIRDDDRRRAHRELSGEDLSLTSDEGRSSGSMTRNPQDPLADYGEEDEPLITESEQEQVENVVQSGVEDAEHEQMLESRRRQHPDEPTRTERMSPD